MADELERVRISAAELRAESVNFTTHSHNVKEFREESKKQRPQDIKRPDLHLYKPGTGRRHRGKDRTGVSGSDPAHRPPEPKISDSSPEIPGCSPEANHNDKGHECDGNLKPDDGNAVKSIEGSGPDKTNCPKKMRKPDREIYQPGGRRGQGNNPTGLNKDLEKAQSREEGSEKSIEALTVCEKRRNRRGRSDRKNLDSPSANKNESNVEDTTSKFSNLHLDSEERRGGGRQEDSKLSKVSGEGKKYLRAGEMVEDKKKEKGHVRSKPAKEKTTSQVSSAKEEGQGGDKSSEGKRQNNSGPKRESRDKNTNEKQGNRPKEKGKPPERGDPKRSNAASKRYSQSDIRRPRNRTYSSSSASSETSIDGHVEVERPKEQSQPLSGRKAERGTGPKEFVRGTQARPRRRTARTLSSTDSMEDSEVRERDVRRRRPNEAKSSPRAPEGGILRISLDKQSNDEQLIRKKPCGRGRGILVLPAHTDLALSPDPSPLLSVMRGRMGLGRGRGGRGGGTRRLWDPNNPDKKPALASSQQTQHPTLQQALYLQQSGCGPLHFLDTDDETTGSPPVRQGEYFQNQQAAAMAYYKFQNSDNPYCYPVSAGSPSTPPRYAYPYQFPYQIPGTNGMYPSTALPSFYGPYGQTGTGYPSPTGSSLTPEEVEVQTRGELGKLLRLADSQELQLSNLLSREGLSPEGLERMAQLRNELLTFYERVILTDIEFSDSQNLDQALWKNVFYQVIERFRQLLKDQNSDSAPQIKIMLMSILEEGAVFFDSLLQKLQTVFQFKLEDYMDCMAIRARPLRKTVKYALISAQRCMICQGDIARYREQASESANYGKARSWYLKAQQIAPKNGRPYNQLALLAVYTKRKLDAVYYYMRSLAASNPILTAKESLMSLFEEAKRKADQIERRQKQDSDGVTQGPKSHSSGRRGEDASRVEVWIRPSGVTSTTRPTGSESGKDSEQDGELGALSASDLNKRFISSFLHAHGKLFTKVGMESFPAVASRVLQEFRALLQHSPSPLGCTRMLQIITINMFTIHNARIRAEGQGETRSALEEQAISLGLAMFGLLVQRCTDLLKETPAEAIPAEELGEFDEMDDEEGMVRVSVFAHDLRELLPSMKVWSDWMLGHSEKWNPAPCTMQGSPDVWQCLADLCNSLSRVYHGEVLLYKADVDGEGDEELRVLQLEEDKMLSGFVPLLAAPQEACYIDRGVDLAIAADCKRVTVLKYFLEALCGQEDPLLAFKGGKYISMATPRTPSANFEEKNQTQEQEEDVIVEESSLSVSDEELDGSEDDIRELRARRHALAHKLAQQQKRRDKIQSSTTSLFYAFVPHAVLQTDRKLEIEVRPFYLVPDTNGFIDHLDSLKKLLACGNFILVVPLIGLSLTHQYNPR
ncbi:hypothetical protein DNTS_022913 [Danionella cerebrum]|uniref:Nonsense-mediated mRNA decay factor n=1 Tax=Danionella cerebrum TaxID=2873325 RepID=A0A553RQB0_9TELE|nr:hypothetical protein DNTS_022913 [Danionella translucida]